MELSDIGWLVGLPEEGIQQAKEALGIYERSGDAVGQADCLIRLARLLSGFRQIARHRRRSRIPRN